MRAPPPPPSLKGDMNQHVPDKEPQDQIDEVVRVLEKQLVLLLLQHCTFPPSFKETRAHLSEKIAQ